MTTAELKSIERRSEFSRLMRLAQVAKNEGDWVTVNNLQIAMTNVINSLSQEV